jgi:hypothetical protein
MSRAARFTASRADGRSNTDVLIALVRDADPGHTYTYAELTAALAAGTDREWTMQQIQAAVRQSRRRTLKEVQRRLDPVIGIGYRLSHAADHSRLALVHERKSQRQLQAAIATLRETRMDELTAPQRSLHEAHLTVTVAIGRQVQYLSRKSHAQDAAIDALISRVERLESGA